MVDSKLQWMPFYGHDFFNDLRVRLLSRETRMVYIEALWLQWREGWVPAKPADFAHVLSCDTRDAETILAQFFVVRDEGRAVNKRLAESRDQQIALAEKNRVRATNAGKASGRARSSTPRSTPSSTKKSKQYDAEFDAWWKRYPKRSGSNPKPVALTAYRVRRGEGVSREMLLDGVDRYAKYVRAADKEGTELVMQAKRWLGKNEAGWEQPWDIPTDPDDQRILDRLK